MQAVLSDPKHRVKKVEKITKEEELTEADREMNAEFARLAKEMEMVDDEIEE